MRKYLFLSAVFVFFALAPAAVAADTVNLANDVKKHWSHEYVWYLQRNNLVQGYPDGTFKPDQPVTRAEFTKMFITVATNQYVKTHQLKTVAKNNFSLTEFKDAEKIPEWAKPSIEYAVKYGYINGYPDGTFGPEQLITKAQAVSIIGRTMAMEYDIKSLHFIDPIPQWAQPSVAKATQYGIVQIKKDGLFNADIIMTRADIAKFLYIYYVGKDIESN